MVSKCLIFRLILLYLKTKPHFMKKSILYIDSVLDVFVLLFSVGASIGNRL